MIVQEKIKLLKNLTFKDDTNCMNEARDTAIESMEKQIPKKPKHIHEEYEKHQWKKKENGEVDDWAWGSGFCNGVVCERCGESICVHCNPDYDDEPCIVDKDVCPTCGNVVYRYENKKYCGECGQALKWSEKDD